MSTFLANGLRPALRSTTSIALDWLNELGLSSVQERGYGPAVQCNEEEEIARSSLSVRIWHKLSSSTD